MTESTEKSIEELRAELTAEYEKLTPEERASWASLRTNVEAVPLLTNTWATL